MNYKKLFMSAGICVFGLMFANAGVAQTPVNVTISGLPAGEYVGDISDPLAGSVNVVAPLTSMTANFINSGSSCSFEFFSGLSSPVVIFDDSTYGGLELRADGSVNIAWSFSPGFGPSLDQSGNLVLTLPPFPDAMVSPNPGYSAFGGPPYTTPGAVTMTFNNLASTLSSADLSTCFPGASSSSQPSQSFPLALTNIFQKSVEGLQFGQWANWLDQNGNLNLEMLERFKGDRVNNINSIVFNIPVMSTRNAPTGWRMTGFNLNADDDRAAMVGSVSFLDAANGWRRVGSGDLSYSDVENVGTTASLNGRMSWERYISNTTMHGYFIGTNISQSDLVGSFGGDQDNLGVSLGTYAMSDIGQGIIASGYIALALNRNDLLLNNGTTAISDSYDTRSLLMGGTIAGEVAYENYRVRPTMSVNYAHANVGTLSMTEVTNGSVSDIPVEVGTVRFMELVASPTFLFDVSSVAPFEMESEFAFGPRVSCERKRASTSTNNCGGGIELGLTSTSLDGASALNARFGYDEIGGQARRNITLSGQLRF